MHESSRQRGRYNRGWAASRGGTIGADWDAEEEAEALRALDPYGNNMVSLDAFTHWWAN